MENKTPLQIIEATQNSPFDLNKLSEEFIAIETSFNQTVSKLKNEKEELDKKVASEKSFLSNKYKQIIFNKEEAFSKGDYIPTVVATVCKGWNSSARWHSFLKNFCIILGAAMVLSSWVYPEKIWYLIYKFLGGGKFAITLLLYKVYVGFGVIAVGVFIFNNISKSYQKKVEDAKAFINKDKIPRTSLDNLSDKMKKNSKKQSKKDEPPLTRKSKR